MHTQSPPVLFCLSLPYGLKCSSLELELSHRAGEVDFMTGWPCKHSSFPHRHEDNSSWIGICGICEPRDPSDLAVSRGVTRYILDGKASLWSGTPAWRSTLHNMLPSARSVKQTVQNSTHKDTGDEGSRFADLEFSYIERENPPALALTRTHSYLPLPPATGILKLLK